MKNIDLRHKRILYISTTWFHYDQFLMNKLKELGGTVDSFRIDLGSLYFKIVKKIKVPHAESYKNNYYDKVLLKKDYDYILIRYGYQLGIERIRKLRILNPNAIFINFHWDSLRPQYNYLPIIEYFDKVFSFDYKDCQNHTKIKYLPLFYIDEYALNNSNQNNKQYDILFIGAWRDRERYEQIKLTEQICKRDNLRFNYYLQSSLKTQFDFLKNYGIIQKDSRSKRLSHKEIIEFFNISKSIIDFPSSFQTGLTIRAFETLAAGLKLITTNAFIMKEPFYNPEFISIIDINKLKLDIDFIKHSPKSSMTEVIKDYSITNYINKLLQ